MSLPNVNVNVGEQTLTVTNTSIPFVPAVLMKTKSGPINTIETITSEAQFKAIFGESDYTTPSAYAIQVYLRSYAYVLVTRTLKFTPEGASSATDLVSISTDYKTDLFNGKEVKLVYDGTAHKLWLDVSAITGKNTISIKEDFVADTATADKLEAALDKLVASINAINLGITLENEFTGKTASDTVPTVEQYTAGISAYIQEGNSGNTTDLDAGSVKTAIDLYDTPDRFIDVMVIPEYNNYEVVNYATELALKNNFIVLATPSGDTVQSVLTNITNYNTENRGSLALYYPNVYYNNFVDNTGALKAIPACIAVLHTYAKTDINSKWGAPAGVNRGTLTLVNSLAVQLSTEDLTVLYDNTIPVNGINNISGRGFVVWGNKTVTSTSRFFDRVNVSRLVKYITKQAYLVSWDYLFEPITLDIFTSWSSRIESMLDVIKIGNGLSAYEVIMDSSINTDETIARNELNGIIRIKPQEVAEFINIDLIVTDTIEVSVEE